MVENIEFHAGVLHVQKTIVLHLVDTDVLRGECQRAVVFDQIKTGVLSSFTVFIGHGTAGKDSDRTLYVKTSFDFQSTGSFNITVEVDWRRVS